jgi:hypothetical protein
VLDAAGIQLAKRRLNTIDGLDIVVVEVVQRAGRGALAPLTLKVQSRYVLFLRRFKGATEVLLELGVGNVGDGASCDTFVQQLEEAREGDREADIAKVTGRSVVVGAGRIGVVMLRCYLANPSVVTSAEKSCRKSIADHATMPDTSFIASAPMTRKATTKALPAPRDVHSIKHLQAALSASGDYVYAYYGKKEHPESPFYVGKGRGNRVLTHWENAASTKPLGDLKDQEIEIRKILESGRLPTVKLLAYNVEETAPEHTYSLVERVIQDAFGIQKVWDKRPGMDDRLVDVHASTLVQVREDSARSPVLSLDALVGLKGGHDTINLQKLVSVADGPVLLVGLMKTYHPSYSHGQLAQMARMYWKLEHLRALPALKAAKNASLIAWRTLGGFPTIVGAWRIKKNSFDNSHPAGRYSVVLQRPDFELRRQTIGRRLEGNGTNYMGPRIVLPDTRIDIIKNS